MHLIIIFLASYLHFIIVGITILFLFFLHGKARFNFVKVLLVSLGAVFIISRSLNKFIISPRPFVHEKFSPLIFHIPDNGFPSEHTLLVITLALSVYYFNKKVGILLLILGVLVGVGRILAGVHHLLDILGSIIISICVVSSVYIFLKRFSMDCKK